jgi:hypothetical protein
VIGTKRCQGQELAKSYGVVAGGSMKLQKQDGSLMRREGELVEKHMAADVLASRPTFSCVDLIPTPAVKEVLLVPAAASAVRIL